MIGRKLVLRLLERGALRGPGGEERPITKVIACDLAAPDAPLPEDPRLEFLTGDFGDPGLRSRLLTPETAVIFHLAAVVSGAAEEDFELGWRVNLHHSEALLEAARALGTCPRVVFASSAAVFGGDLPEVIEDGTALNPQTSYGAQKAMVEFLLTDYSRKGFLDGRALRLPTIAVRPGKPNKAASSFASSLIRDPLEGRSYTCPVPPETRACLLSPRRVVESFVHAAELPAEAWGPQRAQALFGLTVTVAEMVEALRAVAGDPVAERIAFEPDPVIMRIVESWPVRFGSRRAHTMGFEGDRSLDEIIRGFIDDDLNGEFVS